MFLAGLTGGIGSGKSTVAAALASRGAVVIDADLIAREVVAPGGVAYQPLVDHFGPTIVAPDGSLDRPALAAVAFADADARAALNRITHPAVGAEMLARVAALADSDAIVVLDIPLLVKAAVAQYELAAVVVVDTPEDVAVTRLVSFRGFTEADARARINAQIGRPERRALADLVAVGVIVDNSGDRDRLDSEIARAWTALERAARS